MPGAESLIVPFLTENHLCLECKKGPQTQLNIEFLPDTIGLPGRLVGDLGIFGSR